jgi:hypothetical protein
VLPQVHAAVDLIMRRNAKSVVERREPSRHRHRVLGRRHSGYAYSEPPVTSQVPCKTVIPLTGIPSAWLVVCRRLLSETHFPSGG